MSHLAIFALGPLRIELDGQPVQTSRHKALALLVHLARCPEKRSRAVLSALLWPDYSQEKAFAYLRRALWELHSLLGEGWLEADRQEIWLNQQANIFLDVDEFLSHLAVIKQHNHPITTVCQECLAHLNNVALLYRGDFLAGFSLRDCPSFEDWQFFQCQELQQAYASALQRLTNLLYQGGAFTEAIAFARRWLALDNFNEEAHRLLMKIYYRSGQRHLAIRQYKECERVLQAELGVVPEPMTIALYESISLGKFAKKSERLSNRAKMLEQQTPEPGLTVKLLEEIAPTKESRLADYLPTRATVFVGREKEISCISTLLSDPSCWLLSLLGPGGIGKTRLALEVGRRISANFPQGVCFISLSMVAAERSIAPAMARGLGLIFRQNGLTPEEQLLNFLSEKRLLLILDSFEQLVPWATWLERIHAHAPDIKLLVTSRHRLALQGEKSMEVKGLDFPKDQAEIIETAPDEAFQRFSALKLFQQAAYRNQVTFQPSAQELTAIIQIARRLEGMPLGLELAATWLNTLTCQEIAAEINHNLDILESTQGNISERQRSIKAVFDHSWRLLSRREQTILPRLTVFRGSFSSQAAKQIAGASLHDLSSLVGKSLVRRAPNGRFDLHDLLGQYCARILKRDPSDSQETRRRHCAFYSARLIDWNEQLKSVKQGQVLLDMDTDLENCLAAWEWAVSQMHLGQMEQAVDGLGVFYLRRARFEEGQDHFRKANHSIREPVSRIDNQSRARLSAHLLIWQAAFSMNRELFEEANQLLHESQLILDDPDLDQQKVMPQRIFGLTIQGLLANLRYDSGPLLVLFEQVFRLSRLSTGKVPRFSIFFWRFLMGGGAVSRELYLQIEKSLADVRQSGDPFEIGCTLFILGIAELFHYYRLEKAEALLMESCQSFQLVEDPSTQGMIFMALGYLLLVQGKFEDYYALKRRELEIYQDLGDNRMTGKACIEIGEVLYHLGKYHEAENQIREGLALLQGRSDYEYALRHRYLGDALLVQGKFVEAKQAYQLSYHFFQSVDDKGWMMTALTGLSRTEYGLGDRSSAWRHARQALQLYSEIGLYTFFVYLTLADIAILLADAGERLRAVELYNLVTQQGYLAQSRWFTDLYAKEIEEAVSHLAEEEQAAVKSSSQAMNLSRLIDTLLAII